LETFTDCKPIVSNPHFEDQRQTALKNLNYREIDQPIIPLIKKINSLPYCFTLQCCYGHFLYSGQQDEFNVDPLPQSSNIKEVEYRIAYVAFCVEDNVQGQQYLNKLKNIVEINPQYIQFGCADWFWERQVNSYVLQVEPDEFKYSDKAIVDHKQALQIESIRNQFFKDLSDII
jgi:hypothetical protein